MAPVGFETKAPQWYRQYTEQEDDILSSGETVNISLSKESHYTEKLISRVASQARNSDQEIRVALGKRFSHVEDQQWRSNLKFEGSASHVEAGITTPEKVKELTGDLENIKAVQFIADPRAKTKVEYSFESQSKKEQKIGPFGSIRNWWTTSIFGTQTEADFLRSSDAEVIVDVTNFEPTEVNVKRNAIEFQNSKGGNFKPYEGRELTEGGGSQPRLLHSKFIIGEKGGEEHTFFVTQPFGTNQKGESMAKQTTDIYYHTTHPKVHKEVEEYYNQIEREAEGKRDRSYEGDIVKGGGNVIFESLKEDIRRSSGDVTIATASFQYNEMEDRKDPSKKDLQAKEHFREIVGLLEAKERTGSDVTIATKDVDPEEATQRIVSRLERAGAEFLKPDRTKTDTPHYNLYFVEDINEKGTDVAYLTTRRFVGESHEEMALRITTEMDPKSIRKLMSIVQQTYGEHQNLIGKLDSLDNVSVERLDRSVPTTIKSGSNEIGDVDSVDYGSGEYDHPSVYSVKTIRALPKPVEGSRHYLKEEVKIPSELPASFYSQFRGAPTLPKVTPFEDEQLNEDLNRVPFKERLNRFLHQSFPNVLRSPAFEKDETFLEGGVATLGHLLDRATAHYYYQEQQRRREGFYESSPGFADRQYYDPEELPAGPFEKGLGGIAETVSAISASFLSYGLFRGLSLASAHMEDELNRQIVRESKNPLMGIIQNLYVGLDVKGGTASESSSLSLVKLQGIARRFQSHVIENVLGGVITTVSAGNKDKVESALATLQREVGREPHVAITQDGTIRVSGVGSRRIQEMAKRWEDVSQNVPANLLYWIPAVREAANVDMSREASLADLIGRGLEDLLMTYEQIYMQIGRFISDPDQEIKQLEKLYRTSKEVSELDREITQLSIEESVNQGRPVTDLKKLYQYDISPVARYSGLKKEFSFRSNYFRAKSESPASGGVDVKTDPQKKLLGVPIRQARRTMLGVGAIFGADYLFSYGILGDGGLSLLSYFQSPWDFEEGTFQSPVRDTSHIRKIEGDLHPLITSFLGLTGGLSAGWLFPEFSTAETNPFDYSLGRAEKQKLDVYEEAWRVAQEQDISIGEALSEIQRGGRPGTPRYKSAGELSSNQWARNYYSDLSLVRSNVKSAGRARFNILAASIGFAVSTTATRLASSTIAAIWNWSKDSGFESNELSYLAAQRINISPLPETLEEKAANDFARKYKEKLLKTTESQYKTSFSITPQFTTPVFQIGWTNRSIPEEELKTFTFGFQLFPLLGGGIMPTFPVAQRLTVRPEAERDIDSFSEWLGSVGYRAGTLPSEVFAGVRDSDYENLLMQVGTYTALGGIANQIIPSAAKESLVGRGVRSANRLVSDFGASVLSAPALMLDTTKKAVAGVTPDSSGWRSVGRFFTRRGPSIRGAAPFLLSWIASSAFLDRKAGITTSRFTGEGLEEENKTARVSATATLTAIYGSALSGVFGGYNVFSRPEIIDDAFFRKGIKVPESNRFYHRIQKGVTSRYEGTRTSFSKAPTGATYNARFVGRHGVAASRIAATYWTGQLLGAIFDAEELFAGDETGLSAGFQIWMGGYERPDTVGELQDREKVKSILSRGYRGGIGDRLLQFTDKFIGQLDIFNILSDSGAYADDPNIFLNFFSYGQTLRNTSGDITSTGYTQFQGSSADLSYTIRSLSFSGLKQTDKEIIKQLLKGDKELSPSEVVSRVRTLSPRGSSIDYTQTRGSEAAQATSSSLSRALAIRSFYAEHLSNKRPTTIAVERYLQENKMKELGISPGNFVPINISIGNRFYGLGQTIEKAYEKYIGNRGTAYYTKIEGLQELTNQFVAATGSSGAPRAGIRRGKFEGLTGVGSAPAAPLLMFTRSAIGTITAASLAFSLVMSAGRLTASGITAWENRRGKDIQRQIEGIASHVEKFLVKHQPSISWDQSGGRGTPRIALLSRDRYMVKIPGLTNEPGQFDKVGLGYGMEAKEQFFQAYEEFLSRSTNEIFASSFDNRRLEGMHGTSLSVRFRELYKQVRSGTIDEEEFYDKVRDHLGRYKKSLKGNLLETLNKEIPVGDKQTITLYQALTTDQRAERFIDDIIEGRNRQTLIDQIIQSLEQSLRQNVSPDIAVESARYEIATRLEETSQLIPSQAMDEEFTERFAVERSIEEQRKWARRRAGSRPPQGEPKTEVRPQDLPKVLSEGVNFMNRAFYVQQGYGLLEGASLYAHSFRDDNFVQKQASQKLFWKETGFLASEFLLVQAFKRGMGLGYSGAGLLTIASYLGYNQIRKNNQWFKNKESDIYNWVSSNFGFLPRAIGSVVNTVAESPSYLPFVDDDFNLFEDVTGPWIAEQYRKARESENDILQFFSQIFLPASSSLYNRMRSSAKKTAWGYQRHFYGDTSQYWKQQQQRRRRKTAQYGRSLDIIHSGLYGFPTTVRGRAVKEKYFRGDRVADNFSYRRNYPISQTLRNALEVRQRMSDLYAHGYVYRLNNVDDDKGLNEIFSIALSDVQALELQRGRGGFIGQLYSEVKDLAWNKITRPLLNRTVKPLWDKYGNKVGGDLARLKERIDRFIGDKTTPIRNLGNSIKGAIGKFFTGIGRGGFGDPAPLAEEPNLYQLRKLNRLFRVTRYGGKELLLGGLDKQDLLGYIKDLPGDLGARLYGEDLSRELYGTGARKHLGRALFGSRLLLESLSNTLGSGARGILHRSGRIAAGVSLQSLKIGIGSLVNPLSGSLIAGLLSGLSIATSGFSLPAILGAGYAGIMGTAFAKNMGESYKSLGNLLSPKFLRAKFWQKRRKGKVQMLLDEGASFDEIRARKPFVSKFDQLHPFYSYHPSRIPLNQVNTSDLQVKPLEEPILRPSSRSKSLPTIVQITQEIGRPTSISDARPSSITRALSSVNRGLRKLSDVGLPDRILQGLGKAARWTAKGFSKVAPDVASFGIDLYFINRARRRVKQLDDRASREAHYRKAYGDLYGNIGAALLAGASVLAVTALSGGLLAPLAAGIAGGFIGGHFGRQYGEQRGSQIYDRGADTDRLSDGIAGWGSALGSLGMGFGATLIELRRRRRQSGGDYGNPASKESRIGSSSTATDPEFDEGSRRVVSNTNRSRTSNIPDIPEHLPENIDDTENIGLRRPGRIGKVAKIARSAGFVGDFIEASLGVYGLYEYHQGMKSDNRKRAIKGGRLTGTAIGGGIAGTLAVAAVGALALPAAAAIGLGIAAGVAIGSAGSYIGAKIGESAAKVSYRNRNKPNFLTRYFQSFSWSGEGIEDYEVKSMSSRGQVRQLENYEEKTRQARQSLQKFAESLSSTVSDLFSVGETGRERKPSENLGVLGRIKEFASNVVEGLTNAAKTVGRVVGRATSKAYQTAKDWLSEWVPSGGGDKPIVKTKGIHPNVRAVADMVSLAEGTWNESGYRTMFGGRTYQGDLSEGHPNVKIRAAGFNSEAFGKYQWMWETAQRFGLDENISPKAQDRAFVQYLKEEGLYELAKQGNYRELLTGRSGRKIAGIWAGLPGDPYGQGEAYTREELVRFARERERFYKGERQRQYQATRKREKPVNLTRENIDRRAEEKMEDGTIALTFDDGPSPQYTEKVLDVLEKHDATATFFIVGKRAKKHPELVKQIVEEGHEIGIHSYSHRPMSKLSKEEQIKEIRRTRKVIRGIVGEDVDINWFRAPYGRQNQETLKAANEQGLSTALWTVDTRDYLKATSTKEILDRLSNAEGEIVLLHDAAEANPEYAQQNIDLARLDKSRKDTVRALDQFLSKSDLETQTMSEAVPRPESKGGKLVIGIGHSGSKGESGATTPGGIPEEQALKSVGVQLRKLAKEYGIEDQIAVVSGGKVDVGKSSRPLQSRPGYTYTAAGTVESSGAEYVELHYDSDRPGGRSGVIVRNRHMTIYDAALAEIYGKFSSDFRPKLHVPNEGGTILEIGAANDRFVRRIAGEMGRKAEIETSRRLAKQLIRAWAEANGIDLEKQSKESDKAKELSKSLKANQENAKDTKVDAGSVDVQKNPKPKEKPEDREKVEQIIRNWEEQAKLQIELAQNVPEFGLTVQPDYDGVKDQQTDTTLADKNQEMKPPRKASHTEVEKGDGATKVFVDLEDDEQFTELSIASSEDLNINGEQAAVDHLVSSDS